jgi:hypothetical protein
LFRKCGQYAMETVLEPAFEPAARETTIALRHA